MVDFEFETEGDFVPGSTTEWDVFQMLPGDDAPVYLATLYNAREKAIRVELNGPGSGSFAINRSSPECTEANLAQGNLVKVRIPEIHDDYIFAFFLETGDFTLISSQEAGGEMLTFGGRGILSYLEYARAWSESYIDGGQDPIAGVWRAYAAGTGSAPGQILRRMLEEFQDPDRPQFPIPHLTIDFDYDDDSTGDPWDTTDATDEFSYQVGEDGLAILLRLLETETITVQMGADFLLRAYNIDNYGRDLAGDAFGADIVRFERGENIATELRRELGSGGDMMGGGSGLADTNILVQGEADAYGTAVLSDAAERVTKEAFLAAFGTGATALGGIGLVELNTRLGRSDTITFPIANRRTADVVLSDPVSVGGTLGEDALTGFYLPGPEGTLGDFWVGDTVRVHTGSDAFDYNEVNAVVQAISIVREDDNHELMIIPELRTGPSVPECTYEWLGSETTDDALGGALTGSGYDAAASVYPSTDEIVSGTPITYGTPNDGSMWGSPPGVISGPMTLSIRWIWDLDAIGSPEICAVRLVHSAGGGFATSEVQGSDDGVAWTTVVTVADYLAAGASSNGFATGADAYMFPVNVQYRYMAFFFTHSLPGGLQYYDGLDMRAVMFWAAV